MDPITIGVLAIWSLGRMLSKSESSSSTSQNNAKKEDSTIGGCSDSRCCSPKTETKFSDDKFVRPINSNSQSQNDN